jgi:hypothetical protein
LFVFNFPFPILLLLQLQTLLLLLLLFYIPLTTQPRVNCAFVALDFYVPPSACLYSKQHKATAINAMKSKRAFRVQERVWV